MNHQEFLQSLQSRGLRAWQATFVASFLETDSAAFHLLAAPPGTGKSYTSIAIAAELASRGARRMLVLPPASLCDEWRERLGRAQSKHPVVLLTRQVFREMEAAVPIGESPWDADGIFVISQDLAKQRDLAAGLSAVKWDLVIVDEAHRLAAPQRAALLDGMVAADAVRRLLLLTATPLPMLESWMHPSPDEPAHLPSPLMVTSWYGALTDWDGSTVDRQSVELRILSYRRSADEVQFLSKLVDLLPVLESAGIENWSLTRSLSRRAGSSLFAVEQSLRRIESNLKLCAKVEKLVEQNVDIGPVDQVTNLAGDRAYTFGGEAKSTEGVRDIDVDDIELATPMVPAEWADRPAANSVVQKCLDALDLVSSNEKVNVLRELIRSIIDAQAGVPSICVFSMFTETVSYLHAAFDDLSLPLFKLTGGVSFSDREAIVAKFLREGGVMLGTDGGLSEGIAMPQVTHVIHYDLPSSQLVMAKRRGRFDRFGRTAPLTMYVLKDETGVLPFESRLIDLIALNQDIYTDVAGEPGDP